MLSDYAKNTNKVLTVLFWNLKGYHQRSYILPKFLELIGLLFFPFLKISSLKNLFVQKPFSVSLDTILTK